LLGFYIRSNHYYTICKVKDVHLYKLSHLVLFIRAFESTIYKLYHLVLFIKNIWINKIVYILKQT